MSKKKRRCREVMTCLRSHNTNVAEAEQKPDFYFTISITNCRKLISHWFILHNKTSLFPFQILLSWAFMSLLSIFLFKEWLVDISTEGIPEWERRINLNNHDPPTVSSHPEMEAMWSAGMKEVSKQSLGLCLLFAGPVDFTAVWAIWCCFLSI